MPEFLTTRPCVLVVDNELMSRTLMDAVLRQDDRYEVLTAADGPGALDAVRRKRPDLLLLNAVLPDGPAGDGFAVCRALKSETRTRRIPVVLVTGAAASQGDRTRGLEAGADDFLAKPFNRVELLARVRSLIRIKALNDQLDEVEDVIYSLSRAVEAREGGEAGTAGAARVATYAAALGAEAGLSDEDLRSLRHATMLRDIGKLGLPHSLLNKPGALDEGECRSMQHHPVLGEQIVSPLRTTATLLPIIRHHHERVDGSGYPDGLAGNQIPLGARIVAIADAYDAMTSLRPYRPALSPARAVATLQAGSGRQWDSALVDLFVRWLQSQTSLK
ncbi:MAG: response regulator [Armatimonadetes bacterium]|nr:response regulator [Armatimonadota bacterium]